VPVLSKLDRAYSKNRSRVVPDRSLESSQLELSAFSKKLTAER
jgi:hypothetical protein